MWKWLISLFKRIFGIEQVVVQTPPAVITPASSPGGSSMTGNKYGLTVGINKYITIEGNDLNGCVNDSKAIWHKSTGLDLDETQLRKGAVNSAISMAKQMVAWGFKPDNIEVLLDERATQKNILEYLNWLVNSLKPGDQAIFHYSGHGSQIRCEIGDELDDQMDEILCPTDLDWDNPLTDDMLAELFKKIPEGAFLTFIADCCHSGTIDRGLVAPNQNPHPAKARFIPPPFDIASRHIGRRLPTKRLGHRFLVRGSGDVHFVEQRHLLLSGCRDDQTSADAYIDGKYQGALTAYFLKTIEANPSASWVDIHATLLSSLKNDGYDQVPQLSGPEAILKKVPFA